jgi:hypothetical protein
MRPSDEFLESLRDLIREEVKATPSKQKPRDQPSRRAVIALLVAAVNVALLLTVTEEAWKDSAFVRFVGKVVPFLFGAAFVALLDDIRKQILRLCHRASVFWAMMIVLATLLLVNILATVPARVHVHLAEGSSLTVDGKEQIRENDSRHEIALFGFRSHKLQASHTIGTVRTQPITDVIEIGPWTRIRAMWLPSLILGPDSIDASNLFPLVITIDSTFATPVHIRARATMPRSVRTRVQRKDGFAVDSFHIAGSHRLWSDPLEIVWLTLQLPPDTPTGAFYLPDRKEPVLIFVQYGSCSSGKPIRVSIEPTENEQPINLPHCGVPIGEGVG